MAMETENFVLPAGKLFFNLKNDDGTYDGERYIGDTPGFSISVETERVQFFSSDSQTREKKRDIVTEINRSGEITCRDMTAENVAMFLAGDAATLTQTSASVTDEALGEVKQGRYYQLGTSTSFPAGAREVSTVVIKTGATTHTVGDDYTVDAELGRIYIVEGGSITDGTAITADYARAAATIQQVASGDVASRQGRLRFVANNREGANKDAYMPSVDLGPSGALEFKGEDWQEIQFSCEVLTPETGSALYINNRAVLSA